MNKEKRFEYDALLREDPESGCAWVPFPWDLRKEFGKGLLKVRASFDGVPYEGSVVNMGVKNPEVKADLKRDEGGRQTIETRGRPPDEREEAIRKALNKREGDRICAVIEPKEGD